MLLLGGVALRALPFWSARIEQRLLQARIEDARAQPLSELLGQLARRSEQLQRHRSALAAIAAQIAGLQTMLEQRREQAPGHDTHKQAQALTKMQAFYEHHLRRLGEAEQALEAYRHHVTHKRFEHAFAEAGQRVLDSLGPSDHAGVVRELLSDEASRSVQEGFERVFASLELELHSAEGNLARLGGGAL